MLDKTIPFYNTIMKCSDYAPRRVDLPDGFSIVSYQYGYEKEWAKLEYAIGDFDSSEAAEKYFVETYLQNSELFPNILFLLNKEHNVVGSCIAWQDIRGENSVSSLHWLVVHEQYQGIGLGKTLGMAVMNIYAERDALPVYIHTQPWSWKAILLYLSLGFRLQNYYPGIDHVRIAVSHDMGGCLLLSVGKASGVFPQGHRRKSKAA